MRVACLLYQIYQHDVSARVRFVWNNRARGPPLRMQQKKYIKKKNGTHFDSSPRTHLNTAEVSEHSVLAGHKRLLLLRAYTFQNWNACFYCVSGFAIFWSVLYFYVHKVVFLLSAHFGCQIKKMEPTAVKTLKNRKNRRECWRWPSLVGKRFV